jgi:putative glycosyltransferase (TIGR04372 family)
VGRYTFLAYALSAYFSRNSQIHVNNCESGLLLDPSSQTLLDDMQSLSSTLIVEGIDNERAKKPFISELLNDNIVYTTSLQMAIGHYHSILDIAQIINIQQLQGIAKPIVVLASQHAIGLSILRNISQKFSLQIKVVDWTETIQWPIAELARSFNCNPFIGSIRPVERRICEKHLCRSAPVDACTYFASPKQKHVVMHLRTAAYKESDQHPNQRIRSVDPLSYEYVVDYLKNKGYRVVMISAAAEPRIPSGAEFHCVCDQSSEVVQWNLISTAEFMIGTQSGISGLSGLCDGKAVYTNFTALHQALLVSSRQLFSCKRITPRKELANIPVRERISLLIRPWVQESHNSHELGSYVDLRDLTKHELLRTIDEYYEYTITLSKPEDFHSICAPYISVRDLGEIPNWFLATDTVNDIRTVLDFK